MLAVPLCLERRRLLRLEGEALVQASPPAAQGADVDGATRGSVHVGDRTLDLGDNGLLLEREENGCTMIPRRFYEVLTVRDNELFLVVSRTRPR